MGLLARVVRVFVQKGVFVCGCVPPEPQSKLALQNGVYVAIWGGIGADGASPDGVGVI